MLKLPKSLLIVFLLLLNASQFAFALHEIEHVGEPDGHGAVSCELCLHAGSAQHGVAAVAAPPAPRPASTDVCVRPIMTPATFTCLPPPPRAPPLV